MQPLLWIALPLVGGLLGWTIRWLYAKFQLSSVEQRAERLKKDAVRDADGLRKELTLETRDALQRERNEQERELRERRNELQRFDRRLLQKEENLEQKALSVEKEQRSLVDRERNIEDRRKELQDQEIHWRNELERISGLTQEEAKNGLIKSIEDEARHGICE